MAKRVKLVLHVEFEAQSEAQARAVVTRLRGDLTQSIQHGASGKELTGVVPGSIKVEIRPEPV